MLDTDKHTALTRARMPRALEVYSDRYTHIARTPKVIGFVDPTRLTFPNCPKVAEREASLPAWDKYRMVTDVSMDGWQALILTPVGTVMAGEGPRRYVGPVEANTERFHPVAVPAGFVPDHIMHLWNSAVILSMGDRQMISGDNEYGRLGLGHENEMTGFEELPFRVDRIPSIGLDNTFNYFLSGRQLLFTGQVLPHIAQSGLLPGYSEYARCLTATPFRFPKKVRGFYCQESTHVWVTDGHTHFCNYDKQYAGPFEVTVFGNQWVSDSDVLSFRNSTGQWFYAKTVSDGVAELVECEVSIRRTEIIPVDLDPWAEQ
ncbi:hypothetical protein J8273_3560 [Carpediemonas membranifera]|uniref:Uncharacterized protein n=1 Tax=Carpediemonas membranifera TaxID=201153 RepID=A0A8J6B3D0_9EUKA|nr:hypothetical protein J8273_3560 [Carpediemonas membranifera]|eukprot:KAG9393424.1 hypothetical protein J8273_3560 [Carpediemonas membranifera]